MILKFVKIVGISLGALFLMLFGIAFSKVDKNSTNKLKDAWNGLFKKKNAQPLLANFNTKGILVNSSQTVINPETQKPVEMLPKYTDKLGLTYEGQSLYKKYSGSDGSVYPNIGYLTDGSLITVSNSEYRDGEYKKKILPDTGVVLSSYVGMKSVDGILQRVYGQKTGVNILNLFGAIGFLDNGNTVFQRVFNVGQTNEYSYYAT